MYGRRRRCWLVTGLNLDLGAPHHVQHRLASCRACDFRWGSTINLGNSDRAHSLMLTQLVMPGASFLFGQPQPYDCRNSIWGKGDMKELVQKRCNSRALAIELHVLCAKTLIFFLYREIPVLFRRGLTVEANPGHSGLEAADVLASPGHQHLQAGSDHWCMLCLRVHCV